MRPFRAELFVFKYFPYLFALEPVFYMCVSVTDFSLFHTRTDLSFLAGTESLVLAMLSPICVIRTTYKITRSCLILLIMPIVFL